MKVKLLIFVVLLTLFTLSTTVSAIDFIFTGFVINTTYDNVSGVNVTMSRFAFPAGQGPPTLTQINNTQSGSEGDFTMIVSDPGGSANDLYKLQATQYNISGDNLTAIAISPEFPELPPQVFNEINGSNIFVQPATTINITATVNASLNRTNFTGIVMDDKLGMPIGDFFENVFQKSVVVPSDRNYTVVIFSADFSSPPLGLRVFDTNLTDATHQIGLRTFDLKVNLTTTIQTLNGTFDIFTNTTTVNVTDILLYSSVGKIIPLMMSPMNMRTASPSNISGPIGYNLYNDGNLTYNMSAIASTIGTTYLLAAYGRNGSNGASGTAYYAGYQNFTHTIGTDIKALNVTLYELAGNYTTTSIQGDISTSRTTISVRDNSSGSGGDEMSGGFGEIIVTYVNQFGPVPLRFIMDIQGGATGGFAVPLLWVNKTANIQNNVTLQIFNNQFSPVRKKLNLSLTNISIELKTFEMKRHRGSNESFEHFDDTDDAAMSMTFVKNQAGCNVYNPPMDTCRIGNEQGGDFNPMAMAVAGKVNIFINTSSATIHFIGVDMMASGPPDAIVSEEPNQDFTSGANREQVFRFGSLAPDIYDNVLIGLKSPPCSFPILQVSIGGL